MGCRKMSSKYYKVNDVMQMLECSATYAYKIIAVLNENLQEEGYITVRGKVPKAYFKKKMCLEEDEYDKL